MRHAIVSMITFPPAESQIDGKKEKQLQRIECLPEPTYLPGACVHICLSKRKKHCVFNVVASHYGEKL